MWKIAFYNAKVEKAIDEWPVGLRGRFVNLAVRIEKEGPQLVGGPHIAAMGKGLFEIRAKAQEGIARAFFCTITGKVVVILHEFIKKTQKTPQREIEIARRRMKEVKPNG